MANVSIQNLSAALAKIDISALIQRDPSLTIWSRLEALPTSNDLLPGLQAQLADPLWLLARQWQFNEFAGEDAASPLRTELQLEGRGISALSPNPDGSGDMTLLGENAAPLEVQVEAEAILAVHPRLNAEAGQHLQRLLLASALSDAYTALRTAYPAEIAPPSDPTADPAGQVWHTLLAGRALDALRLRTDLQANLDDDANYANFFVSLGLDAALAAPLRDILRQWRAWLGDFVYEGAPTSPFWLPQRQEYRLGLFAKRGNEALALRADEYTDGRLDWHSFEIARMDPQDLANADLPEIDPLADRPSVFKRIPTPVRYPGMPADRYWEFEDSRVNFGGLEAGITDLTRILLTEYALVYGNDWFVIPVNLPTNALYRVASLQVIDSFGERITVKPAQNPDHSEWTLFELSTVNNDARLTDTLLLPATVDTLEGLPVESVELARDEMANVVWAIEKRVQGNAGDAMDRKFEAQRLSFRQEFKLSADMEPTPQLLYRLATEVPSHWLPLLPVTAPGGAAAQDFQIQLQRGSVVRFYRLDPELLAPGSDYAQFIQRLQNSSFVEADPVNGDLGGFAFHPRGRLLRKDFAKSAKDDFLRIEEEEVPREGIEVKRQFQYARDAQGRAFLWLGRSKKTARGESSSGLRFDALGKLPAS